MAATHAESLPARPCRRGRLLIVEARFYDDIADELLPGRKGAAEAEQTNVDVLTVAGALEIPSTIAIAIDAAEQRGKTLRRRRGARLRHSRRDGTLRYRGGRELAGAHGPVRRASHSARQRHPDGRE